MQQVPWLIGYSKSNFLFKSALPCWIIDWTLEQFKQANDTSQNILLKWVYWSFIKLSFVPLVILHVWSMDVDKKKHE